MIQLTGTFDLVIAFSGTVDTFVEGSDSYRLDFSSPAMSMYLGMI